MKYPHKVLICIFFVSALLVMGPYQLQTAKTDSADDNLAQFEAFEDTEGREDFFTPGTVTVSNTWQQNFGMRVTNVEKKSLIRPIRVLGRVEADETRIYRINASVDGWITKANYNTVGSLVKKGEVLATYTNPQFIDTEQNYLFAIDTVQRLGLHKRQELGRKEAPTAAAFDPFVLQRQMDALRGMGMEDAQLEEIGQTREMVLDIRITAPVEGFITARRVSPQERFLKGTELYRIEDISRVWVFANVYEREADLFKPGMKATVFAPYHQKTFEATVTDILPEFDASTRTLKIRLDVDNPDYLLRTDMFVDVDMPVTYPPALWVPAGAVLDAGLRQTVFVDQGNGFFAPRLVRVGRHVGDQVEIVSGLDDGEQIAASGNFLLDSESRMELAALGVQTGFSQDPVCDKLVSEAKAAREGRSVDYLGKIYYFFSDDCKAQFEKEPEKYISDD